MMVLPGTGARFELLHPLCVAKGVAQPARICRPVVRTRSMGALRATVRITPRVFLVTNLEYKPELRLSILDFIKNVAERVFFVDPGTGFVYHYLIHSVEDSISNSFHTVHSVASVFRQLEFTLCNNIPRLHPFFSGVSKCI